jgi:hypothetical protein
MRISLECRPSWFGAWQVHAEKDADGGRWITRTRRDSPPYSFTEDAAREEPTGPIRIERELDDLEAEALERCLARVSLPLLPQFAIGLDGTTWKLDLENGWNKVQLEWWPQLPAAWESLRPLLDYLAALAELPSDFPERPA